MPTDDADEALARRLAREGRVAPGVLAECLSRLAARRARGEALDLAQLLIAEGALPPAALAPGSTAEVQPGRGRTQTPSSLRLPARSADDRNRRCASEFVVKATTSERRAATMSLPMCFARIVLPRTMSSTSAISRPGTKSVVVTIMAFLGQGSSISDRSFSRSS